MRIDTPGGFQDLRSRTNTTTQDSGQLVDVWRELQRSERMEIKLGIKTVVSFTVTFEWGEKYDRPRESPMSVELYRDRGIRARSVLDYIQDQGGDIHEAFREMCLNRPGIEELGRVLRVQMLLTEPRPDTRRR